MSKSKPNISLVMAVYNEEANIVRCLDSVKNLVDEIVIVDGGSSDRTVAEAKKYTANITITDNPPVFHINKQKAIDLARGDWILLLDADEEVSEELQQEIKNIIGQDDPGSKAINGYWIPRKNIIFGKWMEHTGWWPDYQLRLFKKGTVHFPCHSVHEDPKLEGESAQLINPLVHYNYQSVSQYLTRLDKYTDNDARLFQEEGKKIQWPDALVWPADEFIKRFVVWQGYQDGGHGLFLSLLQAFYRLMVFIKIWEKEQFGVIKTHELPANVSKIIHKKVKEYKWWLGDIKIKQEKNPIKKLYLKLTRKVNL
jgi:glycosyltransferase involved in cell wall biosynthesis